MRNKNFSFTLFYQKEKKGPQSVKCNANKNCRLFLNTENGAEMGSCGMRIVLCTLMATVKERINGLFAVIVVAFN